MINRVYVVQLAPGSQQGTWLDLDICVAGPVGSLTAPVRDIASFPGLACTTPPAGWVANCGASQYFELRGRTLRLETLFGANGFTPRSNLGAIVSVSMYYRGAGSIPTYLVPPFQLSASLAYTGTTPLALPVFADPAYGPVIRLHNDGALQDVADPSGAVYIVNFSLPQRKDEDYTAVGGP